MTDYRLRWWLDKEWSCPVHDHNVHEDYRECGECGSDDGPREPECLDCWFGAERIIYDEDGWATLNVAERSPWEMMLMQNTLQMAENFNRRSMLLYEFQGESVIKWD